MKVLNKTTRNTKSCHSSCQIFPDRLPVLRQQFQYYWIILEKVVLKAVTTVNNNHIFNVAKWNLD